MKYKITNVANPDEFIKNGYIKIHPWIPNGKHCIKKAPMENGYVGCLCFSVEVVDTRKINIDGKAITFATICFDTEQYDWNTDYILIVDDIIWLEAIEGGIQVFRVEEAENE